MIRGEQQSKLLPTVTSIFALPRLKGWPYLISWCHRVSGVFLVIYLWLHVYTLLALQTPELFVEKMSLYMRLFPNYFDWLLAIPVIFHSLNGGRLLLYELYGARDESLLLKIVGVGSGLYLLVLGSFMARGDQSVSPFFFWSQVILISCCIAYPCIKKLRAHKASLWWKLQRVSAAFLLLLIPAHMLFMHLDPAIGRDVTIIIERMSSVFIKIVDSSMLIAVLYHAGYGLTHICFDYLTDKRARIGCASFIIICSALLGFFGLKMTLLV